MRRCLLWLGLMALLLPAAAARAEDLSGRTGLGLEAGAMKLTGGEHDYSRVDEQVTLSFRRGLSPHWSLEFACKYGWVRPGVLPTGAEPDPEAGFTAKSVAPVYTVIWQPRLGLLYHFLPSSSVSPFLGLAAGATTWRVKNLAGESAGFNPGGVTEIGYDEDGNLEKLTGTDPTGTVSAGLECFLSHSLSLGLGARYHFFPGNKKDNIGLSDDWNFADLPDAGPAQVDANTGMMEAFAGLTLHFGQSDRDGDGLVDRLDACPDEPEDVDGFEDADGCPDVDNDRDGIIDSRDKCPNQAEDKDGFEDADGCPDPDNDGDGVLDAQDQCPDEAEDKDGFEDADGCPDPDNDGDNVLDPYDKCPDTPKGTSVTPDGCPIVAPAPPPAAAVPPVMEIKQELILKGVTFITGSAQLAPESSTILDEVARSLQAYPDIAIEIRGHTDSAGASEANRALSQRRAIAVRDYLIGRGISPARLSAVGFGEDYPIASNDTAEGRAQNRRVEIHRLR